MPPCPTADALKRLLDGAADPATARHVEGCPSCQSALDALTADPTVVPQTSPTRFQPPADFLVRLADAPPPRPPARDDPPAVPGLTVRRLIGRGGFGVVYEAVQESVRRVVAVKVLDPGRPVTAAERTRFRREAEAVARLDHPNVVRVFAAGEVEGRPYLVLEHAAGLALADQLVGDPWPAREAAGLVATLADAVQAAHAVGIVHRDLKPANILFAADGTPKVADFGLAKLLDEAAGDPTLGGPVVGTPSYAAPEQLAGTGGPPAPAADVYALGAVLYELLTGRPPFRGGRPLDVVLQALHDDPLPPARLERRVPRDLDTVCLTCLHKSAGRRYPTAAELAADLRRFLAGRPVRARPTPAWERGWKWGRRHPAAAAAALAGVALSAGLAVALVWLWQAAEARAELEAHARHQTELRAEVERQAAQAAGRRAAELRIDHLLAQCEQGEVGRGLAGLTKALGDLPADAADLRRLVRLNLHAWRYRLATPSHALPHPNVVRHLRFSPDGRTLATAARLRVRVWDVAAGTLLGETPPHPGPVQGLAMAGPVGASWAATGPARVWVAATGRVIAEVAMPAGVTTAALAPDGAYLVCGSADGRVRKIDGPGFDRPAWEVRLGGPVGAVAVGPTGLVFAGTADGDCRLLTLDGRPLGEPLGAGGCRAAEFDAPGRLVAVTASESVVHLYEATAAGLVPHRSFNPRLPVRAVATARTGLMAVGLGGDGPLPLGHCVLFDTAAGRRLATLELDGPVATVSLSPGGDRLLAGGGHRRASVWVGLPERPARLHLPNTGFARASGLSPDGRTAAVGRDDTAWAKDAAERSVQLWALPPDQRTGLRLPHPAAAVLAADPAGRRALTADPAGRVQVWELATAAAGPAFHLPGVDGLAVHPGGRRAVAAVGPTLHPLDLAAGTVGPAVTVGQVVRAVRYSPDGRLLAVGGGKRVSLRDADTLQEVGRSLSHATGPVDVGFSPDGSRLVSISSQGDVTAWDVATRTAEWVRKGDRQTPAAAVSPDGRRAALGGHDRTVRLVAVGDGVPEPPPVVLPDMVTKLAWTPDGRLVLAVALDGTCRLLDSATNRPVGPPLPQRVTAAVPLACGRAVLAAGVGPAAVGWAVPDDAAGR